MDPLDPDLPREIGDTGVQFAAWGQSTNRFYTGSSDGKVKAWNIKESPGRTFVRDVLSLAGAIISGAFSKDFSKLLIGDATGKVHLMSINDKDLEGGPIVTQSKSESAKEGTLGKSTMGPGNNSKIKIHQLLDQKSALLSNNIKRPKLIIPHKEPPARAGFEISLPEEQSVVDIAQGYLNEGWLTHHVGQGVYQGPNYAETQWVDRTAHEDNDPTQPLLPEFLIAQQFMVREEKGKVSFDLLPQVKSSDPKKHKKNMSLDLALSQMSLETRQSPKAEWVEIEGERVEIEGDFSHTFSYELLPDRNAVWRSKKKMMKSEASSSGSNRERSLDDADETMD